MTCFFVSIELFFKIVRQKVEGALLDALQLLGAELIGEQCLDLRLTRVTKCRFTHLGAFEHAEWNGAFSIVKIGHEAGQLEDHFKLSVGRYDEMKIRCVGGAECLTLFTKSLPKRHLPVVVLHQV